VRGDTLAARSTESSAAFSVWILVGAAVGLGALVFPTLGLVLLTIVAVVLIARPSARRSSFGGFVGAALPLLFVAWQNRAGPGWTCSSTASSTTCGQLLDPAPWLLVGLTLLVGGIVGQLLHMRRR
jgi:hypothetical protein